MTVTTVDAIVIGAGLSGIYQTYSLLKLGLSVRTIEKGEDVGGTWLWNKYPGAVSDTWSQFYRYSWDKEDLASYPWTETYLDAPEILEYLRHVVKKYDLRRHMLFSTQVSRAKWLDEERVWSIETSRGLYRARYLITALGLLSEPNWPHIPNRHVFQGQLVHTSRWPADLDLTGKKVGVIGNGSTGVQVITEIAPYVGSLTCFQRSPQYTVPSGRKTVNAAERASFNTNWDTLWHQVQNTSSGLVYPESTTSALSMSSKERERVYEAAWIKGGGIHMLFGTFNDLATNEAANQTLCDFIKCKIATIVSDPVKREALTPTELYTRRPISDTGGYYEQFNRPNVSIVRLSDNPITTFTPTGLELADGSRYNEFDVIICATGFAAFDGAYSRVEIVGRDPDTNLYDSWTAKGGPVTTMGVCVNGFPNLLMVLGPLSPLSNVPPMAEACVEFISAAIARAEQSTPVSKDEMSLKRVPVVETTVAAQEGWRALCDELSGKLLFGRSESYLFGAHSVGRRGNAHGDGARGRENQNGKEDGSGKPSPMVFFGGLKMYRDKLRECREGGFTGFVEF